MLKHERQMSFISLLFKSQDFSQHISYNAGRVIVRYSDTTGQGCIIKKKISVKCGQVDTETSAFLYKHTSTECETLGIGE